MKPFPSSRFLQSVTAQGCCVKLYLPTCVGAPNTRHFLWQNRFNLMSFKCGFNSSGNGASQRISPKHKPSQCFCQSCRVHCEFSTRLHFVSFPWGFSVECTFMEMILEWSCQFRGFCSPLLTESVFTQRNRILLSRTNPMYDEGCSDFFPQQLPGVLLLRFTLIKD